jgi:hypothetical protein
MRFDKVSYNTASSSIEVDLFDLDGINGPDLVASENGGASIYLNDGSGTFTRDALYTGFGTGRQSLRFADMDNDGHMDLLGGSSSVIQGLYILYNNGDATFAPAEGFGVVVPEYTLAIDIIILEKIH